jgi:hypothetical protein
VIINFVLTNYNVIIEMIQDLTPAEKMRVSSMLSRDIPRNSVAVRNSNPEDLKKLQPILAQKIAY